MKLSIPDSRSLTIFGALLLVLVSTRFGHVGSVASLPDASWAVFFISGFYLAREWRWSLTTLLIASVVVDCIAIGYFGVSNYCVTIAYWFIVPAYSALFLGGAWLRRHYRHTAADLGRLALSLAVSVTVCFALTHSSFYWLGGRVAHPSVEEWWAAFVRWYPHFLEVTSAYVAIAALLQVLLIARWYPAAVGASHEIGA